MRTFARICALLACGVFYSTQMQGQVDPQAEKGDALFRDLYKVGINVGHTAIYYGYYVSGWPDGKFRQCVIQASGTGGSTSFAVDYRPFDDESYPPTFLDGLGSSAYWGAGNRSTLTPATWNGSANTMSAARRDAIITEAQQLVGTAYCWYFGIWEDQYGNDASATCEPRASRPTYPTYIRCDGVVQWVYERVGFNKGDRTIDLLASPYPSDRAARYYVASVDTPSTVLQDSATSFTITTTDASSTPTIVEVTWPDNSSNLYWSPLNITKTQTATISYRGVDFANHKEGWKQFSYARETTPPTVALSSPAAGARFTNNAFVTIRGTATDNLQVAAVNYQLNGGGWNAVNGTTNWQVAVVLMPGTNVFQVYSVDSAGNNSPTISQSFILIQTAPIVVQTMGAGTVSPNYNGQMLEIGRNYTITATPASGNVFSNWAGSITASTPTIAFVMQSNLVLQANFIPNPFTSAAGNYQGLFFDTNGPAHSSSGFFNATLGNAGAFSAKLLSAGKSYSLKGQFSGGGVVSNLVVRSGLSPLAVRLQMDYDRKVIRGLVSDGTWTAQLSANRAGFNALSAPAPQSGKYTLLIPGGDDSLGQPAGNGFGTVSVDAGGNVTFTGSLSDGTKVAQKTVLSQDGLWPFYVSLYSGKGSVFGWLMFTNGPEINIDGAINWFKLPLPTAKLYPSGFTLETEATGSAYHFTNGLPVLNLNIGDLWFENGSLTGAFTNLVSLDSFSKVLNHSSNKLSVTIATTSGSFKGSVVNPVNGTSLPFSGVVLQKANFGSGYFLNGNKSGRVYFVPAP